MSHPMPTTCQRHLFHAAPTPMHFFWVGSGTYHAWHACIRCHFFFWAQYASLRRGLGLVAIWQTIGHCLLGALCQQASLLAWAITTASTLEANNIFAEFIVV